MTGALHGHQPGDGHDAGKEAGAKYLTAFVEEMKASGFVAQALKRHQVEAHRLRRPAERLEPEHAAQLASLVHRRTAAALGTLHAGAPVVSMVPYAVLPDGSAFVIHVSRLAAHTKDMLVDRASRSSLCSRKARAWPRRRWPACRYR